MTVPENVGYLLSSDLRPPAPVRLAGRRAARAPSAAACAPARGGLGREEPLHQRPKADQLLGQAKPGDVLRNLLVEASGSERAWTGLQQSIPRVLGFALAPPDATGPHIPAGHP